jgi:hypothetical protein
LPAVGDRNGDGTPDAEGYDTPDEGDATGICGNGLDDDLADFDADTVPDLADGSADDGCVVTLTAVENCVEIVDNGMLDADEDTLVGTQDRAMIDITVGSSAGSGVPADLLLSAWQYQLNWDVDVLDVDANNINFLILASGGATPFTVVAPAFPVGTSPFVTAVSDAGPQEMGPGIISRMTIEGNAPGLAVLTLSNFAFQGATSGPIAIDTVNAAGVAVSKDVNGDTVISGVAEVFDCGSFTPPTPTPTATATPTPPPPPATATPTPTPSPTPTPTPTPPPPGSFSPYSSLCLDDATTGNFPPSQGQACDGSVAVDAFSDVRTTLGVAAPQSNFAALTSYTPAALLGTPKIALGAIVGKLWSRATLGLINNACQNPIIVDFTFFYSSTDPTDTIDPKPFGQQNTLQPLAQDLDNNGLPDGVDRYPTYLARAFDQDYDKGPDGKYGTGDDVPGPLPPLEPVARFTGFTVPAGTNVNVVLVFMLFAPGTNLATLNNPDVPASAEILGYPSVTILQDPTAPPAPSAITDFCSPLDVAAYNFAISRDNPCTPAPGPAGCPSQPPFTVPFTLDTSETCDSTNKVPDPDNNEAGCPTRRNPAAGTYTFTTYTRSLRDADGDGHENLLDTCNNVPNPSWNPRFTDPANDVDSDGLPRGGPEGGCDPNNNTHSAGSGPQCPGGTYGGDEDQDCYPNRGDNCPIVFNQDQLDNDADGIGTACDANPTIDDGAFRELCIPVKITFGGSETIGVVGAAYPPPCTVAACEQGPASCPTPSPTPTPPPLDDDKDGVPNADDRCPGTTAGATVDQFGCSAGQTPGQTPGPGLLFRDARVKRIAAPHSVRLRPGVADTSGPVTLVVHQGSNHPNNVGIYLAFLPPLGSSNFAGCSPAAVVNLGSANLTPGETATIKLDPPWQCADPMAVDGVPWTLKAIADVNADDFASCATLNQVFSGACSAALANDDDDDTNNTRLRSRPLVDYRP